jgi:hypothetical protein
VESGLKKDGWWGFCTGQQYHRHFITKATDAPFCRLSMNLFCKAVGTYISQMRCTNMGKDASLINRSGLVQLLHFSTNESCGKTRGGEAAKKNHIVCLLV